MRFVASVSKGSRFNQIYVPGSMSAFEPGDTVEVRLLQKRRLHYSNIRKLSPFKENLVREIFAFLRQEGVQQIFVVGSFLTQKVDYNDIDLVLVADKPDEERIYAKLSDKFNLRFHVIPMTEGRFARLLEICPLTRSMFYYNVSDKPFAALPKRKRDTNHLRFLLMMPEDVAEIAGVSSRVLYDALRRLLTIEAFLGEKDEDPLKVNAELQRLLGPLFQIAKSNEPLDEKSAKRIKELVRLRLAGIYGMIENGKNRDGP